MGAPEDETEQLRLGIEKAGAVYRCQTVMPYTCHPIPFDTSGKTVMPYTCHAIPFDTSGKTVMPLTYHLIPFDASGKTVIGNKVNNTSFTR